MNNGIPKMAETITISSTTIIHLIQVVQVAYRQMQAHLLNSSKTDL